MLYRNSPLSSPAPICPCSADVYWDYGVQFSGGGMFIYGPEPACGSANCGGKRCLNGGNVCSSPSGVACDASTYHCGQTTDCSGICAADPYGIAGCGCGGTTDACSGACVGALTTGKANCAACTNNCECTSNTCAGAAGKKVCTAATAGNACGCNSTGKLTCDGATCGGEPAKIANCAACTTDCQCTSGLCFSGVCSVASCPGGGLCDGTPVTGAAGQQNVCGGNGAGGGTTYSCSCSGWAGTGGTCNLGRADCAACTTNCQCASGACTGTAPNQVCADAAAGKPCGCANGGKFGCDGTTCADTLLGSVLNCSPCAESCDCLSGICSTAGVCGAAAAGGLCGCANSGKWDCKGTTCSGEKSGNVANCAACTDTCQCPTGSACTGGVCIAATAGKPCGCANSGTLGCDGAKCTGETTNIADCASCTKDCECLGGHCGAAGLCVAQTIGSLCDPNKTPTNACGTPGSVDGTCPDHCSPPPHDPFTIGGPCPDHANNGCGASTCSNACTCDCVIGLGICGAVTAAETTSPLKPLPNVLVELRNSQGHVLVRKKTDAQGLYSFAEIDGVQNNSQYFVNAVVDRTQYATPLQVPVTITNWTVSPLQAPLTVGGVAATIGVSGRPGAFVLISTFPITQPLTVKQAAAAIPHAYTATLAHNGQAALHVSAGAYFITCWPPPSAPSTALPASTPVSGGAGLLPTDSVPATCP